VRSRGREMALMLEQNPNLDFDIADTMFIAGEKFEDWLEYADVEDMNEEDFTALSQLQG
jgi:hypothetical protein